MSGEECGVQWDLEAGFVCYWGTHRNWVVRGLMDPQQVCALGRGVNCRKTSPNPIPGRQHTHTHTYTHRAVRHPPVVILQSHVGVCAWLPAQPACKGWGSQTQSPRHSRVMMFVPNHRSLARSPVTFSAFILFVQM